MSNKASSPRSPAASPRTRRRKSSLPAGSSTPGRQDRKVSYFYDSEIGNFHYGFGHPMKPHRVRMTHDLIVTYGLYRHCDVFRPELLDKDDLTKFHSRDYIDFLATVSPHNLRSYLPELKQYSVGQDCPIFSGLYDFSRLCASGSVGGAVRLNSGNAEIAINWGGGLHHAKKKEASGFCYVNDCVLAILELLKKHARVMYIDIDIHHGDGVEEAFYTSNRVLTVSFHKYGDFFPGTGDLIDEGHGEGKGYSVNVPLNNGIDDDSFAYIFQRVIGDCVETFRPGAVVLQCGADSLAGDRLGVFNLSLRGHATCVEYVDALRIPMLVLGGGGYTMRNVARCWTYETAKLLNVEISNDLPPTKFFEYYTAQQEKSGSAETDYKLHIKALPSMRNENSREYLDVLGQRIREQLRQVESAPSVEIRTGNAGTRQDPAPIKLQATKVEDPSQVNVQSEELKS